VSRARYLFAILIGFGIAGCAIPKGSGPAIPLSPAPESPASTAGIVEVGCAGVSGPFQTEIGGRFVLAARFLAGARPSGSELEQAVRQEIRYLNGRLMQRSESPGPHAVLAESEVQVLATRVRAVRYGRALVLTEIRHPEVKLEEPYLVRAARAGRTGAGDPAWEVSFRARVGGVGCLEPGASLARLDLEAPIDPYLAYWHVPARNWRPITWHKSFFVINPCADTELADLPDPYFYWYFWDPARRAVDDRGRSFDCRSWLREGRDYRKVRLELRPRREMPGPTAKPPVLRLSALRQSLRGNRPLRIDTIFGIIEPKTRVFPSAEWARWVSENPRGWPERMRDFIHRSFPEVDSPDPAEADRGARYWTNLLLGLGDVLAVEDTQADWDGKSLRVRVRGQLRRSGQEVDLRAFLGDTDLLGPGQAVHWPFLLSGLNEADIVVYNGHSGLGKNVSLESIAQGLGRPLPETEAAVSRAPAYQLVAVLSCYSNAYFADELASARRRHGYRGKLDQITTASEYTSERGTLGLLDLVDRTFARDGTEGTDAAGLYGGTYFRPADFLVFRQADF
jgi:hypothetical protein